MQKSLALAVLSSLALAACSSGGGSGSSAPAKSLSQEIVNEAMQSKPVSGELVAKMKQIRESSDRTIPSMSLIKGESSNAQKDQDKLDMTGRQWLTKMRASCTVDKTKSPDVTTGKGSKTSRVYVGGTDCPIRASEDQVEVFNMDADQNEINGTATATSTNSQQVVDPSMIVQSGVRKMTVRMDSTTTASKYNPQNGSGVINSSGTGSLEMQTDALETISAKIRFESVMAGQSMQMAMVADIASPSLGTMSMSVIVGSNSQPEFRIGGRVVSAEEFNSIFGNFEENSTTSSSASTSFVK